MCYFNGMYVWRCGNDFFNGLYHIKNQKNIGSVYSSRKRKNKIQKDVEKLEEYVSKINEYNEKNK